MGRSGASLVLGALVTFAGPLDLLTRRARRSSPIHSGGGADSEVSFTKARDMAAV